MTFKIAILSYNRVELIKSKTLKTIEKHFGNKYDTYIFTPYPIDYIDTPDNILICPCDKQIVNARNDVMNFFDIDEHILMLDDDIDDLIHYNDTSNIENEILNSFKIMDNINIHLGGFNPTYNKHHSQGKYKVGFNFCVGCAYLLINDRYYMNVDDELEDYHRSIEYYNKDGVTFRNDRILIKTNYETNKGGIFSLDRYDNKNKQAIYLLYKYPDLVELNMKSKYLGIKLKQNKKTEIVKVSQATIGLINGQYSKHTKSSLDENKNYFFVDGNKIVAYVLRNLFHLEDKFKYKIEQNENSGDIAGIMSYNKLPNFAKPYYNEYVFNKQKTRTAKTESHKFEISNAIYRKSKPISDCPKMSEIYNKIGSINVFNRCNRVVINKDLCSGFHRDLKNNENYVLLITKNNKLILDIPEYNLIINNKDGDIVVFDAKRLMHGNNEGDCKDRYSIVFFNSRKI